ncbi:pectate lyase-like adhesive domain-containing protein [Methanobrevibacter sp.]
MMILFLFSCLSLVSATNVNIDESVDSTDYSIQELSNNDYLDNEEISLDSNQDKNSKDNGESVKANEGSLDISQLNQTINLGSEDTIKLENDYAFNNNTDSGFIETGGIILERSLTIDGQGHTIDLGGKIRFLNTSNNTLTLKNINIINGFSMGNGGALYLGANATITNSTFVNNNANSSDDAIASGGAIYIEGNITDISDCTFINNSANQGGAIDMYSHLTVNIKDSQFLENKAGNGGALSIYATVKIENSIFKNNYAGRLGGAFFKLGSKLTIKKSEFTNNSAEDSGGVFYTRTGEIDIEDSSFYNNTAYIGGAAYQEEATKLNIKNSKFRDNSKDNIVFTEAREEIKVDDKTKDHSDPNLLLKYTEMEVDFENYTYGTIGSIGYNVYCVDGEDINKGIMILLINDEIYKIHNITHGGSGIITLVDLDAGNYNLSLIYNGSSDFASSKFGPINFTVYKHNIDMNITSNNITYGNIALFNITIENITDGVASLIYKNKTYTANITGGVGSIYLNGLDAGNYNFNITFDSKNYYATKIINLTVNKQATRIIAKNANYIINYGSSYKVRLNKKVANLKVRFLLKGKTIATTKTDASGLAKIKLSSAQLKKLRAGTWKMMVIFQGDKNYAKSNVTTKITIKKENTKLSNVGPLKKYYKSTDKTMSLVAKLLNSKNKIVKNQIVYFKVNNKKIFKVKTNAKGVAVLKLNAPLIKKCKLNKKGKYNFTVSYKTTSTYNQCRKNGRITVIK